MRHPICKVHVYQFSTKSVHRLVKTLPTNLFAKKNRKLHKLTCEFQSPQ